MTSVGVRARPQRVTTPPRPTIAPRRQWMRAVYLVGIALPFVVVATRVWLHRNRQFIPFADHALLELQLRDIWSHPPQLGVYSRFGWNHPGPLATYFLAAGYWLTGASSLSMWIAATVLNASAAITVAVVMVRRLGPRAALLGTGVLAVYLAFLGPLGLSDPGNPIVSILPFLAFVFCCWDAWMGGRWTWIGVVLFGSVAVQSHLQYAAPVVLLIAISIVGAWRSPRADNERSRRPVIEAVVGLGVVLWALPAWDAVRGSGNVGRILDYAFAGRGQQHSWRESAAMAARELVAPVTTIPSRSTFHLLLQWPPPARAVVVLAALLGVATVVYAIWRRRREAGALLTLGGVGWFVAVVECTRMERELWPYLVAWISTFFVVFATAALATVLPDLRRALRKVGRRDVLAVSASAVIGVVLAVVMAVAPWRPLHNTNVVGPIAAVARAQLADRGVVLITGDGAPVTFELASLADVLVREGVDVRVPNDLALMFGWRAIGAQTPALTLRLVVIDPTIGPPQLPDATLFASAGGLALYQIA